MRKLFLINIILFSVINIVQGQIENLRTHTQMNLDCKKCHICDTPTKANPCLILCPRNQIEVVRHSPDEGPDKIIINEINDSIDIYKPSEFTHRLHSEMSLMSGGCSICHHFNPPGEIVKCSSCHEPNRQRADLTKPDLKAAFHRQCMNCHKTWENASNCENCHLLNSKDIISNDTSSVIKTHPEIEIPIKIVYETESDEGIFVTFYHNDHSSLFGNECNDCHDQESCANCHSEVKLESITDDEHENCENCHKIEDNCTKCHNEKITEPFNHRLKTKFNLSPYHSSLPCINCHMQNKFTGLNDNCISCHKNSEGYFSHEITKLELDETHIELECENCHQIPNYAKKPTCDECHDEDISYPNSKPGKKVN